MKNLREGLVGEWLFNGDAKDTSGNGNHGVVNGATLTEDRLGRKNRTYSFGGSDGIEILDDPTLEMPTAFTLLAWVYVEAGTGGAGWVLGKRYAFSTYQYHLGVSPTLVRCGIYAPPTEKLATISGTLLDGWHFVCATYDQVNLIVYLDGIAGTPTSATLTLADTSEPVKIGHFYDGQSSAWDFVGKINNPMILNRALSAEEIKQFHLGIKGNYQGLFDGLVAGYDFQGDALDFSGDEHDGVVTGATLTTDNLGIKDNAYIFNGISDFITLPSSDAMDDYSAGDFTVIVVGAWTHPGGTNPSIVMNRDPADGYIGWMITRHETSISFVLDLGAVYTPTQTVANNGEHIIFGGTRKGTDVQVFKDGVLARNDDSVGNDVDISNPSDTFVCKYAVGTPAYCPGTFDYLLIFKRALSEDEHKMIYDLLTKKNIHPYRRSA